MRHCPKCKAFVTPGASDCASCGALMPREMKETVERIACDSHSSQTLGIMKNLHLIFLALTGIFLVGVFWWGFAGYLASGSGGPPAAERLRAFWIGGVGYLALLFVSSVIFLGFAGGANQAFGRRALKNLIWTVIALLLCFPAAFIFIGFIAPPFILTGSALALMACAFMGPEQDISVIHLGKAGDSIESS